MIEIRLIRKNPNGHEDSSPRSDDVINIRLRHNRDDYLVRYVDGTLPNTVWVQDKTLLEVVEYVRGILYFSMMDSDPFYAVQLTIPGYPIIFVGCADLSEHMIDDMVQIVENVLDNPPASFTVSSDTNNNVA